MLQIHKSSINTSHINETEKTDSTANRSNPETKEVSERDQKQDITEWKKELSALYLAEILQPRVWNVVESCGQLSLAYSGDPLTLNSL